MGCGVVLLLVDLSYWILVWIGGRVEVHTGKNQDDCDYDNEQNDDADCQSRSDRTPNSSDLLDHDCRSKCRSMRSRSQ